MKKVLLIAIASLFAVACSKEEVTKTLLLDGSRWTADFNDIENVKDWFGTGQYQLDFRKDDCTFSSIVTLKDADGDIVELSTGNPFTMQGTHPYTYKNGEVTIHINSDASAWLFNYDGDAIFTLINDSTMTGELVALDGRHSLVFNRANKQRSVVILSVVCS